MTLTPEQFSDGLLRAKEVFAGELFRSLGILALEMEGDAKRNASTTPHPRRGRLRGSIAGEVHRNDQTVWASLNCGSGRGMGHGSEVYRGPDLKYAATQEFGLPNGQVPRLAKFLRVPLPPALTGAGADRYSGPLRETGKGVFHVIKTEDGRLFLKHNETGDLWYSLVKHTRPIPATRFLGRAFDEGKKQMPDILKEAFKGVFPGQVLQ